MGRQIKLQFAYEIPENQKEAYSLITDATHLVGTAELENVALTLDGISLERAKAWLGIFAPDLIERIDSAILNNDGSPNEVIEALQELDLTTGLEEPDDSFAIRCLGVYLNSVIGFEEKLPYLVEIQGKIIIKDKKGEDVYARLTGNYERLLYIHEIEIIEVADKDKETNETLSQTTEAYLLVSLINGEQGGQDLQARVPVDSINNIDAIRSLIPTF